MAINLEKQADLRQRWEDLALTEALGDLARELRKDRQSVLGGETIRLADGKTRTIRTYR